MSNAHSPIPYFSPIILISSFISDEPPDITSMRSVPASWCIPSTVTPTKIWDDTGAGGGKPGSIWTVNSLDMVAVVAGHESPKDIFYEFKSLSFSLEGMINNINSPELLKIKI